LQQARVEIDDGADEHEAKARVVLSAAIVELDSGHPAEVLDLLMESDSLFLSCDDETLKGTYRIKRGLIFEELAEETGRQHFLLRAVSEQKAAGYHLMQAKAKRLFARSENNLGLALFLLGYFDGAAERLGRAHELLTKFGEVGRAALVKESQARLLLAWGQHEQAVCRAAEAVYALEAGERPAVLAEALTTKGIAPARLPPMWWACWCDTTSGRSPLRTVTLMRCAGRWLRHRRALTGSVSVRESR
jgi:tetratricopeptide (TPR) repeat protein